MREPLPLLYSVLLLAGLLLSTASSLGINCRGSSECSAAATFHFGWKYNLINDFYNAAAFGNSSSIRGGPINDFARFTDGRKIVCRSNPRGVGGFCLFTQGMPTFEVTEIPRPGVPHPENPKPRVLPKEVSGLLIIQRLYDLAAHRCVICGSVPLSGDNNPKKLGILTVNYVLHGVCDGFC